MHDHSGSRRSIRLPTYDYSQSGLYFVTICTDHRSCILGAVADGQMHLNEAGRMVSEAWASMPAFWHADIDEFVVMPNHIHGIVVLGDARESRNTDKGRARAPAPTNARKSVEDANPSLSTVIGRFKSFTSNRYRVGVQDRGWLPVSVTLWQRNYYEHVIRNDTDLERIREYIVNNPLSWHLDQENPERVS